MILTRRGFFRLAGCGLLVATHPTIFLPTRPLLRPQWATATPTGILADINRVLTEVWAAPGVVRPDRIIVPPVVYRQLLEAGVIEFSTPEDCLPLLIKGARLPIEDEEGG